MLDRQVVITGLGAITGLGIGAEAAWQGLLEGRSALAPIKSFDASAFPCRIAAEIPDFSARDFVPKSYRKAVKVMARDIQIAVAAARLAVQDARLVTTDTDDEDITPTYAPDRVGCQIGAGLIACEIDELTRALVSSLDDQGRFDLRAWGKGGMNNLPPLWLLKYLPNMLACHVTIIHDAQGPSNTITCAEASGLLSAGESMRVIARGDADCCFTGGAEAKINPMGLTRMDLAQRLARTSADADPTSYVRPYDPQATGGLLGELAGICIVEAAQTATARGARPYAKISGFGAGHSPRRGNPRELAEGLIAAIEAALKQANLAPDRIDAILPHASGIPEVDQVEAAALEAVFGPKTAEIPCITITPNLGDGMAGSGGVALCIASMCLRHQSLPARIHHGSPANNILAGAATQRDAGLNNILVCSNALGGQNAAMILSKP
ncbi:MAG: hypothetical protein H6813_04145 [Phycisphaeraceae bacterium]|nr:hypothetical protein [Phycisphaeraceae bacterium]MCB9847138.1 hypothetical protein [Phycisphaeraceae bacterium]